ncbi:MAG: response regulator [bacterium]|nr:response regulator [bacterium]
MDNELHGLVLRQVRRAFPDLGPEDRPAELERFIRMVSEAYNQADSDRLMLERSLEISSGELFDANEALENRVAERTADLVTAKEEAEASNNAKSRFLANMSHEIRTPLNGVLGLAQLLLDGEPNPKRKRMIEILTMSARSLISIIDEILEISKLEARKVQLESLPFLLREVSEVITCLFHARASEAGLELEEVFDPANASESMSLTGDAVRLRQVLSNLVANAIKFTKRGHVRLSTSVLAVRNGTARIRWEVSDTGIGIAPEAIEEIFERFSQADVSTTRIYGGTGLGLAISSHLVEAMGGTICVESEVGIGSTFSVELSLPVDDVSSERDAPGLQDPAERHQYDITALVAEDNLANQIVARGMLERLGCCVDIAPDGQQAVDLFHSGNYDVVFMDCHMPVLDGWAATELIRNMPEKGAQVPVIAMTATAVPKERTRCAEVGMNDFISKPIEASELERVVARLFSESNRSAIDSSAVLDAVTDE